MKKLYYDFHLHSCLSPCGDDDATPGDIAGMAKLSGLDVAALTDHNSFANCPAFFEACDEYGVTPLAGCELTTAEDIHLVCLFDSLDAGQRFSAELEKARVRIANRPKFFGRQLITDAEGSVIGEEVDLLPNATVLSLEKAFAKVTEYGGVCYPAHIDRESNGMVAVLGAFPEKPAFTCAEFNDSANIDEYRRRYPIIDGLTLVSCSDAHTLDKIGAAGGYFEIEDDEDAVTAIFARLRGTLR